MGATRYGSVAASAAGASAAMSSGSKEHLRGGENGRLAERIPTRLDGPPRQEVDLSSEDLLEIALHFDQVQERPVVAWSEAHQHVDVTFGPEVVSQHRAEEFEPLDFPRSAELCDPALIDRNARAQRFVSRLNCRTPARS